MPGWNGCQDEWWSKVKVDRDGSDVDLVGELQLVTGHASYAPVRARGLGDGDLDVLGAQADR